MHILPFFFLFISLPTIFAEYGDTIATAKLVTVGELIEDGGLSTTGDIDMFSVKLLSGRTYKATLGAKAPVFNLNFKMYNAGGTELASASVGIELEIEYTPSTMAYYYFQVNADDSTVTGDYDFSVGDQTECSEACTDCEYEDAPCDSCTQRYVCSACSNSLAADIIGGACYCDTDEIYNSGSCDACSDHMADCETCTSTSTCTSCYSNLLAFEDECVSSCDSGYYSTGVICESCGTVNSDCLTCDDASTCTSCSGVLLAEGSACVSSCSDGYYSDGQKCNECSTIDGSCTLCDSSTNCLECSGDLVADGTVCAEECSTGKYDDDGYCTSCTILDTNCLECSNDLYCSSCDNSLLISGPSCVSTCPSGTTNNDEICTSTAYKISLSYGSSATSYLVTFPSALVNDISDVISISTIALADIDTSVYSYTMKKKSTTVYQIDFEYTQNIAATTLTLKYSLTGTPTTTNTLVGRWIATITTKYMGYLSESDKEKVETVKTVAKTTMQAATIGAGSLAILGGNPALLWPLLNIFQAFYYLIFINVNYPTNVQMFLQIFSLGSLDFIPNPMDWVVSDIEDYSLPAPDKYKDFEMSGLFLENAGNEMLLLGVVFMAYLMSKIAKKWVRRVPMSIRQLTNKIVGWFEWSGILNSLTTSYTDLAQAIFLQMRVLRYSSGVFAFSSILSFVSLIFIIILPIYAFVIIRRNEDYPELLYIKYDALAGEYDIKKKAGRYFVPIWLIRRLVMILSLVFLQGSPYVQITILSILAVISIVHACVYLPFSERKENICNGLTEVLFGCIHIVIYILIHDDHNASFSDQQRLNMGWAIIVAFGIILIMSLGLSLIEQIKEVKRAIKLVKKLLSKPDVQKKVKMSEKEYDNEGNITIENQTQIKTQTTLSDQFSPNLEKHNSQVQRFNWNKSRNRNEQSQFFDVDRSHNNSNFDLNRSHLDTSIDLPPTSPELQRNQHNNRRGPSMMNQNSSQRQNGNEPVMINNNPSQQQHQQENSGNGRPRIIQKNSTENGNQRGKTHIPVSQIRQMRRARLAERIRELREINS